MPKWLSSLIIFLGFIALIALALLPRNISVDVTTNVKNDTTNHTTINNYKADHNGAVQAPSPEEGETEPEG